MQHGRNIPPGATRAQHRIRRRQEQGANRKARLQAEQLQVCGSSLDANREGAGSPQRRGGRGLAGACITRHPQQECSNAATASQHCAPTRPGECGPRAATEAGRNGEIQAVATTAEMGCPGAAACSTYPSGPNQEHTRKRPSRRSAIAIEPSRRATQNA